MMEILLLILGFLFTVFIGLVSGLYAGLIIARVSKFEELRSELIRIIQSIDFIQNGETVEFNINKEIYIVTLISSEYYAMKHKEAAETVSKIRSEIDTITNTIQHSTKEVHSSYKGWLENSHEYKPNIKSILKISLKI
jgi:ABC-type Fe3+-citrate transport system substrate-binding protein